MCAGRGKKEGRKKEGGSRPIDRGDRRVGGGGKTGEDRKGDFSSHAGFVFHRTSRRTEERGRRGRNQGRESLEGVSTGVGMAGGK